MSGECIKPREEDGAILPIAVTDSYTDKAQQPFEPCKRSNFVIFVDRDWPLLSEVSLLVSTGFFNSWYGKICL